jgi:hypothetical protein
MPMPRIDDALLHCVIYLYSSAKDAEEGRGAGGSGFLVLVPSRFDKNKGFMYAVTNRHVIDIKHSHSLFMRITEYDGKTHIAETSDTTWHVHPDGSDIAIAMVRIDDDVDIRAIQTGLFITQEDLKDYDIGVGDEAFIVGRFISHDGKQKNMPAVRFGNISIMPLEPMQHPNYAAQESFTVDIRATGGISGSPVFARIVNFDPGRKSQKILEPAATGTFTYQIFLLGIVWGHITEDYPVKIWMDGRFVDPPTRMIAKGNTNMAGVVPAWKIMELLEIEPFKKIRENLETYIESQMQQNPSVPAIDITKSEELIDDGNDVISPEDFS